MKRREFLKISGAAALTAAVAPSLAAQKPEEKEQMLVRENPVNGDRVSALGFGCMRWPMIKDSKGNDIIDQEAVNELVDVVLVLSIRARDGRPAHAAVAEQTDLLAVYARAVGHRFHGAHETHGAHGANGSFFAATCGNSRSAKCAYELSSVHIIFSCAVRVLLCRLPRRGDSGTRIRSGRSRYISPCPRSGLTYPARSRPSGWRLWDNGARSCRN